MILDFILFILLKKLYFRATANFNEKLMFGTYVSSGNDDTIRETLKISSEKTYVVIDVKNNIKSFSMFNEFKNFIE